ncbi:MAG: SurA N-terminal domain-containing protein [Thermodesulfobacteriota bacterium]
MAAHFAACGEQMGEDVAAMVNGRPILMDELTWLERTWTEVSDQEAKRKARRRLALDQLIEEELILEEADRLNLTISETELDQSVKQVLADFPETSFQEMLLKEYIDFDHWKARLARNLLLRKTAEVQVRARVSFDLRGWEEFLEAQRPVSEDQKRVKVRHITVPTQAEALKVRERLKTTKDFGQVTREVMGLHPKAGLEEPFWVYPHLLPEQMAKAILAVKAGETTGIVESEFGFTILEVLAVEEPGPPDPKAALADLRRVFQERLRAEAYSRWLRQLKSEARIVVNPALKLDDKPKPAG